MAREIPRIANIFVDNIPQLNTLALVFYRKTQSGWFGTKIIYAVAYLNPLVNMVTSLTYTDQDEQSVRFFKEVKSNLGLRSTRKIVRLVRAVLSQLRRTLSHEQSSMVIKTLPSLFQLLFVANWKYDDKQEPIMHLDELVDHVYQEDRKQKNSLFTSEIDTLNSIILVISKLDKFFGILGLNVFRYSLTQELKQAVIEDPAWSPLTRRN
jgi:uncharacterized protein (DUF2267 family)